MTLTTVLASTGLPSGEGWRQVGELGLALLLSALVGLEREFHQKSAGLRTYTLVGVGAALFMLISKYGFMDVVTDGRIVLDPSRVAAQIVSGVGFLGAGIIFVRRDSVRGLTTAAGVWVTAAIGAAAGAGLLVLAAVSTAVYFVVALVFPALVRHLPRSPAASLVRIRYPDGQGMLRDLLKRATDRGFSISQVTTRAPGHGSNGAGPTVEVVLRVTGRAPVHELAGFLSEIPDVDCVISDDVDFADD